MTFVHREHAPDLIDSADDFAARLAIELRDEPDNRHQGMPSDGDSRPGFAAMGSGRAGSASTGPSRARRARPVAAGHGGGGGALRLPLVAAVRLPPVGQDDRQRPARARLRAAQAAASAPDRGGQASSVRASPSRARAPTWPRFAPLARRDGDTSWSGPQDLDLQRPDRRLDLPAVRTDPDAARPHRGISVLVADMRTPGIEVREIPAVGGGVLCEVLPQRRGGAREPAGGRTARRLARAHGHARPRARDEREGGRGAARARRPRGDGGRRPPSGSSSGRLRGEAQAARLLGRRAAGLLAAGRPAAAASMAKLSIALLARRTAELGAACSGRRRWWSAARRPGGGPPGRPHRASAGGTVAGGAAEIQRRVIARQGLGCAA